MSSGSFIKLSFPLSAKLGISKALLLQRLCDWIKYNKNKKGMQKGGATWVYRSARELSDDLDGNLSIRSIERYLKELVCEGWLIKENYNKNSFDRTNWYTVNIRMLNEALDDWKAEQIELRNTQNDGIAEDSETDILSESDSENLADSITQFDGMESSNQLNLPILIIKEEKEKQLKEEQNKNITKKVEKIKNPTSKEKKLDDRTSQMLKSGIDAFVKSYEQRYKAKFLDFATLSRSIQSIIKKMGSTFSEQNLIDCINCYLRSQNSWHVTKGHSPIYLAGDIQNIFAATQNNRNVTTSLQAKKGDVSQTIDSNIMNALNSLKSEKNNEILDI